MSFVCTCGSEDFYTHQDEEITAYVNGDGDIYDNGEIMDSCKTHNWPYRCASCEKEYSQIPPKGAEAEWVAQRERLYITKNASVCPICESDNISGGSIDMDSTFACQSVTCQDCDAEWTDIYHLRSVEIESYSPDYLPGDVPLTENEIPDPNKAFKGN